MLSAKTYSEQINTSSFSRIEYIKHEFISNLEKRSLLQKLKPLRFHFARWINNKLHRVVDFAKKNYLLGSQTSFKQTKLALGFRKSTLDLIEEIASITSDFLVQLVQRSSHISYSFENEDEATVTSIASSF